VSSGEFARLRGVEEAAKDLPSGCRGSSIRHVVSVRAALPEALKEQPDSRPVG
jgi:hypothetical protein